MKRLLLLAVAVVSLIALSGCTAAPSRPDAAVTGIPAKNLEQWTLPLDQFVDSSEPLRSYVENLMVSDCLGEQGEDWPVPWQPLDRPAMSPSITASGSQLFDEKIAAQYGYHWIPLTYKGQAEQLAAFKATSALVQRDPTIRVKFDACLDKVRKKVPLPPREDLIYAFNSGLQIRSSSEEAPIVKAAAKTWQACIDAAGFGGLADMPSQMPGETKRNEWRLGGGTTPSPISAEERRTASADATCRTSSGWSQTLYDMQYATQAAFVKKNADKLNRIRDALKNDRQRLLAAATKYAPK
jgi:hypothetical protein